MGWGPGTCFIRLHRHKGGDPDKDGLQDGGLGVSERIRLLGTASQSRPDPGAHIHGGGWAFAGTGLGTQGCGLSLDTGGMAPLSGC